MPLGASRERSDAVGDDRRQQLINDAAIVDVAATTFVKGQIYTDSILVQANLVPKDQDHALNTDTNALVSELIAFVDDIQDETCAPSCAIPVRYIQTRWRACCIRARLISFC